MEKEWKIEEKKPKWKGKHKAILCVFKMRQLTETTKAREEEKEEGKGNTTVEGVASRGSKGKGQGTGQKKFK